MNYNLFPSPEFKASWKTDTRSKDLKKQTNKQNPLLWTKHGVEDKISRCSQRALLRFLTDQLGRLTQAAPGCTGPLQDTPAGQSTCCVSENRPESSLRDDLTGAEPYSPTSLCQTHSANSILLFPKGEKMCWGHGEWHCMCQAFLPKEKWWVGNTWSYEQLFVHSTQGISSWGARNKRRW